MKADKSLYVTRETGEIVEASDPRDKHKIVHEGTEVSEEIAAKYQLTEAEDGTMQYSRLLTDSATADYEAETGEGEEDESDTEDGAKKEKRTKAKSKKK